MEVELPTKAEIETEIKTKQAANQEPFAHRNAETAGLDSQLSLAEEAQFKKLLSDDKALRSAVRELNRDDAPELSPVLADELSKTENNESEDKGV